MSKNEELIRAADQVLTQNYRRQPLALVRGEGARVFDADGREYLDFVGGIATVALGHCHPKVSAALKAQVDRLWHVSNIYYTEPQVQLGERLTRASGMARAFFCNSGAEANEGMIKLARKIQKDRGQPGRFEILCAEGSFHGRTLGALAATGQPKYHKGFEPMPEGFRHLPYGEVKAFERAVTDKTAAIMLEPIQGEGGVKMPPKGFLRELRALCDEKKILLVLDEVQTGMGRTGKMWGFQHEGIRPDALSMAKALANGFPIGALLVNEEGAKALTPGTHASTFGGNPLACSAAVATFDLVAGMLEHVNRMGTLLRERLGALKDKLPSVREVRGAGLLIGVDVAGEASKAVARARELGLLVNAVGDHTLRLAPPYVIGEPEIDRALSILEQALREEARSASA